MYSNSLWSLTVLIDNSTLKQFQLLPILVLDQSLKRHKTFLRETFALKTNTNQNSSSMTGTCKFSTTDSFYQLTPTRKLWSSHFKNSSENRNWFFPRFCLNCKRNFVQKAPFKHAVYRISPVFVDEIRWRLHMEMRIAFQVVNFRMKFRDEFCKCRRDFANN